MPSSWFGKRDHGDAAGAEHAAIGDRSSEFQQLVDHLGHLKEQIENAGRQITDYLVRCDSQRSTLEAAPGEQGFDTVLEPLQERLAAIEAGLKSLSDTAVREEPSAARSTASLERAIDAVRQQITDVAELLGQLEGDVHSGLQKIVALLTPGETPEEDTKTAGSAEWQLAVVGPDLVEQPELAFKRQELIDGVLAGDPSARRFAGQLLIFQSAAAERFPHLLKDIGEAYYRWQPKNAPGTNRMEEALVAWLRKTCEAAGIGNTIELVHPGERFDSSRHNASSRGVEIAEVHGWIVLRDNGKVYTKANVTVK